MGAFAGDAVGRSSNAAIASSTAFRTDVFTARNSPIVAVRASSVAVTILVKISSRAAGNSAGEAG